MKAGPEDEPTFRDADADPDERATALSRLASDRRFDLEPELRDLLHDPEPALRTEAAWTLVGRWYREEYLDEVLALLHQDPEPEVRADAAAALSTLVLRTGRQRERIVRELVAALRTDERATVRRRVYEDLLRILAPDRDWTGVPTDFDPARDVDWDLLAPYA